MRAIFFWLCTMRGRRETAFADFLDSGHERRSIWLLLIRGSKRGMEMKASASQLGKYEVRAPELLINGSVS